MSDSSPNPTGDLPSVLTELIFQLIILLLPGQYVDLTALRFPLPTSLPPFVLFRLCILLVCVFEIPQDIITFTVLNS